MVAALDAVGEVGRSVPLGVAVSGVAGLIAGRYRLISRLGGGAMGVVWQAYDEVLHRIVAIKQLVLPSGLSATDSDEVTSLVMREGRITARLQHPHAIAIHDVVVHYGHPCLIMEYLPSRSLATVLSTHGVLVPEAVASIGNQISSALAVAHEAGVVHRDIKPGNVLLADDGTAKITDFGVSHAMGDPTVTAPGILVGTPAYLAPEVAQGGRAGFASDVFSLGSTLYTALEGTPPFGIDDNAVALLHRVTSGEIIPPRRCGALTPLLLHLLQRDPQDRPTMRQAQAVLAMLDEGLARSHGSLSACTLPLSQLDPPVQPLPSFPPSSVAPAAPEPTHSTPESPPVDASAGQPPAEDDDLDPPAQPLPSSPPSSLAPVAPEQTPSTAGSTPVDASADQRPAEDDDLGLGAQVLLVVAIVVAALTVGVLVTLFVGHGPVPSSRAAAFARPSDVPALNLQALPVQPELGEPSTGTPPPTPVIPVDSQGTSEQSPKTIIDYQAPTPGSPPVARNRLTTDAQQNYAGDVTKYRIQRRQSFREPNRSWDRHQGWSGKNRYNHH
jgi:serine/threonine protein kinase